MLDPPIVTANTFEASKACKIRCKGGLRPHVCVVEHWHCSTSHGPDHDRIGLDAKHKSYRVLRRTKQRVLQGCGARGADPEPAPGRVQDHSRCAACTADATCAATRCQHKAIRYNERTITDANASYCGKCATLGCHLGTAAAVVRVLLQAVPNGAPSSSSKQQLFVSFQPSCMLSCSRQ